MVTLDESYWTGRYGNRDTGWDIGYPSTPLKEYIDQLTDHSARILVPGAGNAYEVEYLWRNGFRNTFLLDISPVPIAEFHNRVPGFPETQLICEDFFSHNSAYDLILEQTFFCALHPDQRSEYARKMHGLLVPRGRLAGVLFGVPMNADRPPFGGSREEYLQYFLPYFDVQVLGPCYNSIAPRQGNELFMILQKK